MDSPKQQLNNRLSIKRQCIFVFMCFSKTHVCLVDGFRLMFVYYEFPLFNQSFDCALNHLFEDPIIFLFCYIKIVKVIFQKITQFKN